ncbi:TRAP transporter substrate-binding protein [Castellaniella sp.]|uniref:TRAP transporter substrate-binding protein n=1 Tax=Castellaniella sp. TaxID=1955812 RepID=UPI00355DA07D
MFPSRIPARFGRVLPALALGLAVSLGVGAAAHAAPQVIKIGWTTADSPSDPYAITAHYFAEELEKAAPGQFKVQFYGGHQLGDEMQMLQGLQLGTLDMGVITGTVIGNILPSYQLNDLPFLYASNEQAHQVLDGKAGEIMAEDLKAKKVTNLGFAEAGFRHVINNTRPIETPDDLKGIRLRVQPSDMFIDSFRALGANPVPLPWGDAFTAVQQGTIDGLEIPLAVIYANKFPEVTKHLSLTRHSYNALALLMSDRSLGKLDAATQDLVRAAARAAIERQRATMAVSDAEILDKIRAAGMQVNEVPDLGIFRDKEGAVYDKYRDAIGAPVLDAALGQ